MSVIGWQYSCLDCGGDIALVNEGANHGHAAFAVYACTTCREEWVPRIIVQRVRDNFFATGSGKRLNSRAVDAKAAAARRLHEHSGMTVTAACREVGIDRRSYLDRYTEQAR